MRVDLGQGAQGEVRPRAAPARRRRRFDPGTGADGDRALPALRQAKLGRTDLALASYHMGVGNLQRALSLYGASDIPYAQLYFDSTPLQPLRPRGACSGSLGDDSSTYLWRLLSAKRLHGALPHRPLGADTVIRGAFPLPPGPPRALAAGHGLRFPKGAQLLPRAATESPKRPATTCEDRRAPRPLTIRVGDRQHVLRLAPLPHAPPGGRASSSARPGSAPCRWSTGAGALDLIAVQVREVALGGPRPARRSRRSARGTRYQRDSWPRRTRGHPRYSLHTTGCARDSTRDYALAGQAWPCSSGSTASPRWISSPGARTAAPRPASARARRRRAQS